jgi:hypothetical protein
MGQTKYDPGYDNRRPWNVGKFVGVKRPLTPKQVWKVRFHLEREQNFRDLALFDLAIDSKLHGCDVVAIRIGESSVAAWSRPAPWWCRRRQADRCSSS